MGIKVVGIKYGNPRYLSDVFGEQTYPLIIYSKRRLAERVAEYNEPWHTETSSVSIRSTVTPVQGINSAIGTNST